MQGFEHRGLRGIVTGTLVAVVALVSLMGSANLAGAHTPSASKTKKAATTMGKRVADGLRRDGTVVKSVHVAACKHSRCPRAQVHGHPDRLEAGVGP